MRIYANHHQNFTFLYIIMCKFVDFVLRIDILRTFNQIVLNADSFRCSFVT